MERKLKVIYVAGKGYHNWALYPIVQLRELGHHVIVLCPADKELVSQLKEHGFCPQEVNFPQRLGDLLGIFRAIKDLIAIYYDEQPDVVYHYMIPVSFWSRIAAWWTRVPVRVYKPPSLWELELPYYWAVEFVSAWMDNIILASSRTLEQVYRSWPHTRKHTFLSYLGFPTATFNPSLFSPHYVAEPTNLSAGIVAYLYPPIPKLNPNVGIKGHEILIQAIQQVVAQFPDFRLIIVGDEPPSPHKGEYKHKLEQIVNELGLANHCLFIGARSDVPNILAKLDFVVMPSLSEGLGLAGIEALLMQKPVIASSVGSLPEFIIDNETGFLVPPADVNALAGAIKRMLSLTYEERETMGRKGRRLVENLCDIRQVIDYEVTLYQQKLAAAKTGL